MSFTFYLLGCLLFLCGVNGEQGIVKTLMSGKSVPHMANLDVCIDNQPAPDGKLYNSGLNYPWGLVYDEKKDFLYVADNGCPDKNSSMDRLRRIDISQDTIKTIAGSLPGYKDGQGATEVQFMNMAGLALDGENDQLYIADSGNDVIRRMNLKTFIVETFSGNNGGEMECYKDGPIHDACFNNPQRVELDSRGFLYIADTDNHAIRIINLNSNHPHVKTVTGGNTKHGKLDGSLDDAKWNCPTGMALDEENEKLYVSDHYNHALRVIDFRAATVTTLAGVIGSSGGIDKLSSTGQQYMNYPEGLVLDRQHNLLYIAEFGNHCIRMLSLTDYKLTILAGGSPGSKDAGGEKAEFYHPTTITFDDKRKLLFVADQYNHRIRIVTTAGNNESPSRLSSWRHYAQVDGYRDLYIHNFGLFGLLAYGSIIVLTFLTICVLRRYAIRFKSRKLR